MKRIRKNEKATKERIEKTGNSEKRFSITGLRILRVLLCICVSMIVCSSCALFEIGLSKGRIWAIMNGSASENNKIRIYIDQGHNPAPYHNTGADGNGLYEQDVTFDIGCRLAELLKKDGRFEVCLSRPDETTVLGTDTASSLKARVDGAENFDADYFISLHINSYTEDNVNGIEVFASETEDESYSFGSSLLQGMLDSTSLKNRGMKPSSELYVLENTDMPAALLEMGFISNAEDAALLHESPELFAQGIYDGILNYFESVYMLDINLLLWMIGVPAAFSVILITAAFVIKKRTYA